MRCCCICFRHQRKHDCRLPICHIPGSFFQLVQSPYSPLSTASAARCISSALCLMLRTKAALSASSPGRKYPSWLLERMGIPRSRSAWLICRTSRSERWVILTRSRRWSPCPAPASRNWAINPSCTRSWLVVLWERENFWSLAVAVVSSARLAVPPAGRVFPFLGIHFHRLSALFVQLLSESFDVHKKARA